MKKVNEFHYLCAIQILKNNFKYVSTSEIENPENPNEIILQSENIDPEKSVIKKQEFENLSNEAKEIVITILNCPDEILQIFKSPKIGKISRTKILKTFSEIWQSKIIAESAIQEIKKWVQNF